MTSGIGRSGRTASACIASRFGRKVAGVVYGESDTVRSESKTGIVRQGGSTGSLVLVEV